MEDLSAWHPPKGFVRSESKEEGVVVYAPAPPPEDAAIPKVFTCERCGNQSRYLPGQTALECEHCSSRKAITEVSVNEVHEAEEFRQSTLGAMARGWGAEQREAECQTCGAAVVLEPKAPVTECSFCESQQVVTQTAGQEGLRPNAVLPFTVDEAAAKDLVKGWLRRGKLRPRSLPKAASTLTMHGVYLPFWVFGGTVQVSWHAEVGKRVKRGDKYVTEWHPRSGSLSLGRSGELEPGIADLDPQLLDALKPFPLVDLLDYQPSFLAGWQTRPAAVRLETAWERARQRWREAASRAGREQIEEWRVRNYRANVTYQDERWRYALLPVYVGRYRFKDETFPVLINGRTAELTGRRPVDNKAAAKLGAVLSLPGAILYGVGYVLREFYAKPTPLPGVGALLLFVALVYVGHVWNKARTATGEH